MTKRALIPIANGTEEIEAVTMIDVLRRAGIEVIVASVNDSGELKIIGAHGITIAADCTIDDCTTALFDLIAVPGGLPGSENLAASPALDGLLREQATKGRLYAAICAAPMLVLSSKGLLQDKIVTGHPMFQQNIEAKEVNGQSRVVVDGNCITSQGPGTALDFALDLVQQLCGVVKREEVGSRMVLTTSAATYY